MPRWNERPEDLLGQRFGRLLVVAVAEPASPGAGVRFLCACDCGKQTFATRAVLRRGDKKSCGCWHRDCHVTHGKSTTPTYLSWRAMVQRCTDPSCTSWRSYGAKGVTVCERWLKFENFLADMAERPAGTSLDRIDNNKGYEPGNCRWADAKTQSRNRRSLPRFTAFGQTKLLAEWAEEVGIPGDRLSERIGDGWPVEMALTTPVSASNSRIRRR